MTQNDALNILKMGCNVFLTGAAGTGKTYVLNKYIDYLKKHGVGVAVTASTGIAATHLEGVTIHSWSGMGIRDNLSEYDIDDLESRQYLWKRYEATQVLIIDEVSMLHYFQLEMLDQLCQAFKRNSKPFGGMQVVLCGDFFQLPPVTKGDGETRFAYSSHLWTNMGLKVCYLTKQYRQHDNTLVDVLNDIRNGVVGERVYEHLNSRYKKETKLSVEPTKLSTHNINVDSINDAHLEKIDGVRKTFDLTSRGTKSLKESLIKSCLAPEELVLKEGARVMFVKNNFDRGYVNGTLGVVTGFSDGYPVVKTSKGVKICALPESWRIEEGGSVKAEITQIPLRLAWAITIHKSQGLSLDAAEIDLSKSFVAGMGYVALSRIRSLDGLKLLGINGTSLQVDRGVAHSDKKFREQSRLFQGALEDLGTEEMKKRQVEFLKKYGSKEKAMKNKVASSSPTGKVSAHGVTKHYIMEGLSLSEIAKKRSVKEETIIAHIEKLQKEKAIKKEDMDSIKKSIKATRLKKIRAAFRSKKIKNKENRLSPVKKALGKDYSYKEVRIGRLFV